MPFEEVKAKVTQGDAVVEVICSVDLGENLEDAIERFGEECIYEQYRANAKIKAQAVIRSLLNQGKTPDEVMAEMADWNPTVKREGRGGFNAETAMKKRFATMSPDERAAYLQELQDSLAEEDGEGEEEIEGLEE